MRVSGGSIGRKVDSCSVSSQARLYFLLSRNYPLLNGEVAILILSEREGDEESNGEQRVLFA
ncbi:hypothetical protein ElyMa_006580400, partial [Elysia marginata]